MEYTIQLLPSDYQWRFILGVGALPPLLLLAITIFSMPESTRWVEQRVRISLSPLFLFLLSFFFLWLTQSATQKRKEYDAIQSEAALKSVNTTEERSMVFHKEEVNPWKQLFFRKYGYWSKLGKNSLFCFF
jgi:hypothetical protein